MPALDDGVPVDVDLIAEVLWSVDGDRVVSVQSSESVFMGAKKSWNAFMSGE